MLADKIESEVANLEFDQKASIAAECWAFMGAFKDRHDDRQFLRDGFGVHGTVKTDDRGRGQTGLVRLKLVYDALAASLRRTEAQWRPDL